MSGKALSIVYGTFCGMIVTVYLALVLPISKSFPFTDDWIYVEVLGSDWSNMLRWVVAEHNDHHIPAMKIMQFATLRLSGFDFRAVLVLNVVWGLCGALAMIGVARRFRGYSHFGDLIIPMILLNYAFGLFVWGFAAQYVMSVSSSAIFLFLFGKSIERGNSIVEISSFCFLLVCALSGMNGLVVAFVASGGVFAACFLQGPSTTRTVARYASLVILLTCAAVYASWRPSGASASPFSVPPSQIINWAYQLSKSSFVVSAYTGAWWRSAIVICLTLAAAGVAFRQLQRARQSGSVDLFMIAFYSIFVGYIGLAASLVAGRAARIPWVPGLEAHYGYLVTPIPIFAWLIISNSARPALKGMLAIILLGLYAHSFVQSARWRLYYARWSAGHYAEIAQLIRSDLAPSEITRRYMNDLWYIDAPIYRKEMEDDILKLRAYGGPLYGRAQ
ncbi:MAG TPA: hypothetical protein VKI44_15120 [Acetobacteraceae bacterium]|nr:hypothetical protein [Acetobacteraceae bacterium]